jgi:hypothetical protein
MSGAGFSKGGGGIPFSKMKNLHFSTQILLAIKAVIKLKGSALIKHFSPGMKAGKITLDKSILNFSEVCNGWKKNHSFN